jgi:ABC-type Mn2+/Zn2+ transport system ATPase subunit
MMTLVDCALAKLISIGKIVAADIFVIARAMEDVIDLVLMRSRAHSELASMETSIQILYDLKSTWDKSEQRNFIDCTVQESSNEQLMIDGLFYKRGLASVQINNLILKPGVYAVTGSNGSGKSTLFRILIGCDSNEKSIDLASSIEIVSPGSIIMPSSDVVEISQNVYWPLYTKPIDWIYHQHLEDVKDPMIREAMVTTLLAELKSLVFYRDLHMDGRIEQLRNDLTEVKEDWFGDLSGGQKSKVELIRKVLYSFPSMIELISLICLINVHDVSQVFLARECPKVLLIDETFAPLDPESKSIVMAKLKSFCTQSFVLVIYHADVASDENGSAVEPEPKCLPGNNFFDDNLHVENGHFYIRPICTDID